MRLLITTDTVGGVWTFTEELTAALLTRGHAVSLISFGRPPSAAQQAWVDAQHASGNNHFRFTATDIPLEWMQNNEEAFEAGEAVLHAAAEDFHPDLLLSNQFCFGATTLAIPRIVAAHSDVLSWARAANPAALAGTPWLNRYTALVQRGLLQADAVTAPTQSVVRGLKNSFFLPTNGIVIPNGRQIAPASQSSVRKLQAITAGRLWDEAKGFELLLQTSFPCPVLLAGETARHAETPAPQPPANLAFLGPLAPSALHGIFRESALYLCTSLYEPFGLAPLEAALCGCALVCRDLPSLREVWGESATYFTDAVSLQTAVSSLLENPEALAEAQLLARRRAASFTVERMTDGYLAVCESVLQSKARHVA